MRLRRNAVYKGAYLNYNYCLLLLLTCMCCRYVHVMADVQRPELCLDSCRLHMENAYVGVPCHKQLLLRNNSLIPTHYTWRAQVSYLDV